MNDVLVPCSLALASLTVHVLMTRATKRNTLLDRCRGAIFGEAIGDAKGIPYQALTKKQIQDLLVENNVPSNSVYEQCGDKNPYIPAFYGPGRGTDSTQLTIAMAHAISRSIEFNNGTLSMDFVVEEHMRQWKTSIDGWGGTTMTAIEKLHNKSHTFADSGNTKGVGDGVLIKLGPLAFFYAQQPQPTSLSRQEEIITLCKMTHATSVAIVTSIVYCCFFEELIRDGIIERTKEQRIDVAHRYTKLASKIEDSYFSGTEQARDYLSRNLSNIAREIESCKDGILSDEKLLELSNGGSYHCVDACSIVMGMVLGSSSLCFDMITRMAHIGGDTSPTAGMIGAIVGGVLGLSAFPQQFVEKHVQKVELYGAALSLASHL